jgi:hypothetical protein
MNPKLISRFCLLGLLPVAALQAALFPLWMLLDRQLQHIPPNNWFLVDLPIYQLLITGIAVPVFLCIVGVRLTRTAIPTEVLLTSLLLVLGYSVSCLMDYANWGITTGLFWHPDGETVMLKVGITGLGLILMIAIFGATITARYAPRFYRKYAKPGP